MGSAWPGARRNTTHSDSKSVGGKSVILTVDRAKLQEMVVNNMGVTYPPLCPYSGSVHHKGHLCGQLLAAQFTRTGSHSASFVLILRKQLSFIHFKFFMVFKGEIHLKEYTIVFSIVFSLCVWAGLNWKGEVDCSNNAIYSKILELLGRRWIMKPLLVNTMTKGRVIKLGYRDIFWFTAVSPSFK